MRRLSIWLLLGNDFGVSLNRISSLLVLQVVRPNSRLNVLLLVRKSGVDLVFHDELDALPLIVAEYLCLTLVV